MKQDGRGDVIGQVADHPQWSLVGLQRTEIELERIRVVHGEPAVGRALLLHQGRQIAVDLDRIHATYRLQQRDSQRRLPGPDLHQVLAGLWVDRIYDLADHDGVVQKVLPESFPGMVAQGGVLVLAKEFSEL